MTKVDKAFFLISFWLTYNHKATLLQSAQSNVLRRYIPVCVRPVN